MTTPADVETDRTVRLSRATDDEQPTAEQTVVGAAVEQPAADDAAQAADPRPTSDRSGSRRRTVALGTGGVVLAAALFGGGFATGHAAAGDGAAGQAGTGAVGQGQGGPMGQGGPLGQGGPAGQGGQLPTPPDGQAVPPDLSGQDSTTPDSTAPDGSSADGQDSGTTDGAASSV